MVDGVEADAELAHLERIFRFVAELEVLNAFPVIVLELGIVECQECRSLVSLKVPMNEATRSMLAVVQVEAHRACSSIVSVLNYFLKYIGMEGED